MIAQFLKGKLEVEIYRSLNRIKAILIIIESASWMSEVKNQGRSVKNCIVLIVEFGVISIIFSNFQALKVVDS